MESDKLINSYSTLPERISKVNETESLMNGEYAVSGKEELNLSSKNLKVVPQSHFRLNCIVTLNLNFNHLVELPEFLCESDICFSLKNLFLKGNRLTDFPINMGNLINLIVLDACENKIQQLSTSFTLLKRLEKLKLVGNRLCTLPCSFNQLESLTDLHLDQNYIKGLPSNFEELSKLETLELGYNRLKKLPLQLGKLQQLKYFNLSYNKLRRIPDSICCLKQLIVIDVSHNRLASLPVNFESAPTLTKIYLQNNRLCDLPLWFGELSSIEELNLEDNALKRHPFPVQFGKISSRLRLFELGGNYIENLPDTFGFLGELKHVHLGSTMPEPERKNFQNGNCLTFLPDNFGHLQALVYLRLDENRIKEVPDSFGQLINLEYLDLSHNLLRKLPDSFCQLKSLKTCWLCKNLLNSLPDEFGNLSNLEDLRLDSNMLMEIPESLNLLKKVTIFDLSINRLTQVPSCISHFPSLKYLSLDENDFNLSSEQVPFLYHKTVYPVGGRKCWRGSRTTPVYNSEENTHVEWAVKDEAVEKLQNHLQTTVESENEEENALTVDDSEDTNSLENECWDDDSLSGVSSKIENTSISKNEENWEVESNFSSQFYDDDDIIKNEKVNFEFISDFCPGEDHVQPIPLWSRPKLHLDGGQFSDAEDD